MVLQRNIKYDTIKTINSSIIYQRGVRMMKNIYMYIQDTMADFEHGYLMQALSLQSMLGEAKVKLVTVSKGKKSIKTAGGMTIVPDVNLYDLDTANAAALVLIGGDTWLDNEQDDVLEVASKLLQENILVGAICGATLGLAEKGILDNRYHTSNASFFLTQMSQHYRGQDYYKDEIAVQDGKLITASSAGSLSWTKLIVEELGLYSKSTVEAWFNYFSTGDAHYYLEMMNSLENDAQGH